MAKIKLGEEPADWQISIYRSREGHFISIFVSREAFETIFWSQMGLLRGMQGEKYTKRQLNSDPSELVPVFWTQNGRQRLAKRLPKWMQIEQK